MENLTSLEKEKNNNDKTPKQTNKQTNKGKKGRNLWLIKRLFYNEKNLNIFFSVFVRS